MKSQPRISVLMGVYNGGSFLASAINSILEQTLIDLEFIIIDDGSNDETVSILDSFDDDRLIIIRNSHNIGLTKSLNKGIQLAQGKYIARQDADDISHPQRLAQQVAFLDSHPEHVLVGCNALLIDENGIQIDHIELPSDANKIHQNLPRSNQFIHGSVTFLKSAIMEVGAYRENFRYTQDYDLWLRMREHYTLVNLPENLYSLRRLANSISVRRFDQQLAFALIAREFCRQRLAHGTDSYIELDPDNPVALLTRKYPHLMLKLQREKYKLCIAYAKESERLGKSSHAYDWIDQALTTAPSFTARLEMRKMQCLFFWRQMKSTYNRHIGWRFKPN